MDNSKLTYHKDAFTKNVFEKFTDVCGGDPKEYANILYARFVVEDQSYGDDMYYWGVLKYFQETVVPHKIAVYQAGVELLKNKELGLYLPSGDRELFLRNLWIHDMSKFSADEAFGYALYNRKTGSGKEGFERSWHHHKMNNPHHPEHWLNPNRSGILEPLTMPHIYVFEMIADWIGAGKTYGSTLEEWLPKNIDKFVFQSPKIVASIIKQFTGINVSLKGNQIVPELV